MEERYFHIIQTFVEVLGFCIIIFKVGKSMGVYDGKFIALFKGQKETNEKLLTHFAEDDERYEKVMTGQTEIKVAIAGIPRTHGKD